MSKSALTDAVTFYERLALYAEQGFDEGELPLAVGLLLGSGFPSCAAAVATLAAVDDTSTGRHFREMIEDAQRIKAEALK